MQFPQSLQATQHHPSPIQRPQRQASRERNSVNPCSLIEINPTWATFGSMAPDANQRAASGSQPDLASMTWEEISSWKAAERRDFLSRAQRALADGTLTPSQAAKLHDIGGRLYATEPSAEDLFEPLG